MKDTVDGMLYIIICKTTDILNVKKFSKLYLWCVIRKLYDKYNNLLISKSLVPFAYNLKP